MVVKTVIGSDQSVISGIYGFEERWQVEVGDDVDKIEGYIEDGDTPWFAVYCNGKIKQRVNSLYVEAVCYVQSRPKEKAHNSEGKEIHRSKKRSIPAG